MRCATSASPSSRARASASSANPAPASRQCFAPSAASPPSPKAPSASPASRSPPRAPPPSTAGSRWCSRTPTPRSTPATPSTACSPSRWRSTASPTARPASSAPSTDVGLGSGFRFRYPHQLSGGQRQRVAVARALILEPSLLLLDEPTSALDASIQAEVLNLLERLRGEHGLTYLLVSHDLAVVAHMCNRLVVMQHGAEVEELTRDALSRRSATQGYTRTLLTASRGFQRRPLATEPPA